MPSSNRNYHGEYQLRKARESEKLRRTSADLLAMQHSAARLIEAIVYDKTDEEINQATLACLDLLPAEVKAQWRI